MLTLPYSVFAREQYNAFGVVEDTGNQFPKTTLREVDPVHEDLPVMLVAQQMEYDQENETVTASGMVEVVQGETILLADRLVYDRKTGSVRAEGNVSLMEAQGNVVFADSVDLKDDMEAGIVRQFRARLADNSLFAAAEGRKLDAYRTELHHAVYSPCKVRCGDGDGDPMWQIRADHVLVDDKAQTVEYEDVDFEVFGVPVFYTPYLSHATPGADNKSGLLTPEFQQNDNLGSVLKMPVYYAIAPDRDVTLTPIFTGREGLVMKSEYRQRFDSGDIEMEGSLTQAKDRDNLGFREGGKELRGHIFADGRFNAGSDTHWGFDVDRTTDDTYLRRYDFSPQTVLTSRAYAERFNLFGGSERSYGIVQGLAFQGLTAEDDANRIPLVAPLADIYYESDPGLYNSRFHLNANTMVLYRDIGPKSRRLSMTGGWKLPYITQSGQIIEFATQLRTDMYSVDEVTLSNSELYDGVTGRVVPEASLTWRYPLLNQWNEGNSMMLEPIVALAVSPTGGNPEEIPNEDSLVPEFTDTNLFETNRFTGYDRIETGPRVSYGLRGQAQLFSSRYIDWLFGQHYRTEPDRNFPFSNELNDHFSDYVGKIGMYYLPFDVAYRFRLDKEDYSAKRNEVDATMNYDPITLSGTYLSLQNDPVLDTREEIAGQATLDLTNEWKWSVGSRMDLEINEMTSVHTGFTFKNECTYFMTMIGRQYTRDRDVKPTTTFLFQFALRNLE